MAIDIGRSPFVSAPVVMNLADSLHPRELDPCQGISGIFADALTPIHGTSELRG